jgi:hypothetical protein
MKKKRDARNWTTATVTSFLHVAPPVYKVVEHQHDSEEEFYGFEMSVPTVATEVSDSEEVFYGFEPTASNAAAGGSHM